MQWQRIEKSNLSAALSKLQKRWDVFAPVKREDDLRIRQLPADGKIFLGQQKPMLPLKMLFIPEVEEQFSFTVKGTASDIIPAEPLTRERVVFGALGCDVASIEILDRVFLEEPVDVSYRKRREKTILIAIACTGEGPECFCTSFGIDPLQPAGADALIADVGKAYLLKAISSKGKRIVEALKPFLKKPTKKELSEVTALTPAIRQDLSVDKVQKEFDKLWDLPLWDDLAARCIGCSVCTFLCPTCYCFDVEDEQCGPSCKRFSAWDSCMNTFFTKMASGENPRPTRRERIRQRFLHKLSYFPENNGVIACVGCGRCGIHCPAGISIDEVIVELSKIEVKRE